MKYSLRNLLIVLVIGVLLLPVAYVLSGGPAIWLVHHNRLDPLTYCAIYEPLAAFAYNHPTFNAVMNWYLSWWGGPIQL